jgi:hypothetical protein
MNVRIARKISTCIRCGKTIRPGEPMSTVTTTDYRTAVAHPACRRTSHTGAPGAAAPSRSTSLWC